MRCACRCNADQATRNTSGTDDEAKDDAAEDDAVIERTC